MSSFSGPHQGRHRSPLGAPWRPLRLLPTAAVVMILGAGMLTPGAQRTSPASAATQPAQAFQTRPVDSRASRSLDRVVDLYRLKARKASTPQPHHRQPPRKPARPHLTVVTCWNGARVVDHPNVWDCPPRPKPKPAPTTAPAPVAPPVPSGSPKAYAAAFLNTLGLGSQFSCVDAIFARESGWNTYAQNPSSGAYGIPQALPGSKMASEGADWASNPDTQIRWGIRYMIAHYGSPCGAWVFWQGHGYY